MIVSFWRQRLFAIATNVLGVEHIETRFGCFLCVVVSYSALMGGIGIFPQCPGAMLSHGGAHISL